MQDYATKPVSYFNNARTDVLPLLPQYSERILEVGCGTGSTLRWLKETGRCTNTFGLELYESAACVAREFTRTAD